MPYPIAQGSVLAVSFMGRMSSQRIMNVLHYQMLEGSEPESYQSLVAAMMTNISAPLGLKADFLACLTTDYQLEDIRIQAVYPTRLVALKHPQVETFGALEEASLPQNCAGVISKETQYATRWGRGSMHLAGCPAGSAQVGIWDTDYIQLLATLAGEVTDPLNLGGINGILDPVLYHPATPAKPGKPATPTRITRIEDANPQTTVRVMRRRTVGVGE